MTSATPEPTELANPVFGDHFRSTSAPATHELGAGLVLETIGMSIAASEGTLNFGIIYGIALRRNPRRAHLLVSKVLGKHYPQSPAIIEAAARVLALRVHAELSSGATPDVRELLTRELVEALRAPLMRHKLSHIDLRDVGTGAVVVGFAEAATALGACVASALGAYYVSSTRYPGPTSPSYGAFEEEHSHASAHHLTPRDRQTLDDTSATVILVDDELTTGKTIINTIRMLHATATHAAYIVATLADLRDAGSRTALDEVASELGVTIRVVALFDGELTVPDSAVASAQPLLTRLLRTEREVSGGDAAVTVISYPHAAPHPRDGIRTFDELNVIAETLTGQLAGIGTGNTLVLGVEEDMFLPLRVASLLEERSVDPVVFGATTRSPAFAHDHPDYGILDRLDYTVPEVPGDTARRFAYNLGHTYDSVVIITASAADTGKLAATATSLLDALSQRTKNIVIMEAAAPVKRLGEPLTGPVFGSYKPEDVSWLLKDLSDVVLETNLEDREVAVQNGSHYAESLPLEYQPSAEYQSLFDESLNATRDALAFHVAVVAEQIYHLREGNPVLLSLARAGTPIGVLIRRYLHAAYGIDTPHYALSIVRGRGIDANALTYVSEHHDPRLVMFVDGWTGKGAIVRELTDALKDYENATGVRFRPELAVLADPGSCVSVYGTREDYLIPSAGLNSTVSGLVSRTVLNEHLIGPDDFHGAKFYREFTDVDVSNFFVDTVSTLFTAELIARARFANSRRHGEEPNWSGWKAVERISTEYGINNVNLVKPGVGETTRVLLRRVPWKILVRPDAGASIAHIRLLAAGRGVPIEPVDGLPFMAVGLIHPQLSPGATGFDGRKAS
ncbi:phosphoribosyltransferase domain-containing protein [Cryobacterium psychrophilum]|nr:phosphoribosyltransferase domain-containing protein [Cryobacterium psychrophilum]